MTDDAVHKMQEMRADSAAVKAKFFPALSKGIAAFFILGFAYYLAVALTAGISGVCNNGGFKAELLAVSFVMPLLAWEAPYLTIIRFIALPAVIIMLFAWITARGGGVSAKILIIGTLIMPVTAIAALSGESAYIPLAAAVSWLICVPLCGVILRRCGLPGSIAAEKDSSGIQHRCVYISLLRGLSAFILFLLSYASQNMEQFFDVRIMLLSLPSTVCAVLIAIVLGAYCAWGRPLGIKTALISASVIPIVNFVAWLVWFKPSAHWGAGFWLPVAAVYLGNWIATAFFYLLAAQAFGLDKAQGRPARAAADERRIIADDARQDAAENKNAAALPQAEFIRGGDIDN